MHEALFPVALLLDELKLVFKLNSFCHITH